MQFVHADDLSEVWEFVEAGLRHVLSLTHEPWTPRDVKQHIREGWASLYVCDEGFAVLQRRKADWTADPYINVWVLWFQADKARQRRAELIAWLDEMVRQQKCEWWEFGSPRAGWAGLEADCERVKTIWRRRR